MNRLLAASLMLFMVTPPASAAASAPYAGPETRDIKALSDTDVADYLAGRGMGLAKAAELNHYPGPRHVLDLAKELSLHDAQREQVEVIYSKMRLQATQIGERIVAKEKELDESFATGKIAEKNLRRIVTDIAQLQGDLRFVHLQAHLDVRALLNAHQIARYDALRGYTVPGNMTHSH